MKPARQLVADSIALSSSAPSLPHTSPWLWRLTSDGVELYADRRRQTTVAGSAGRALLLNCGATLHHLSVAMGARGWHSHLSELPDDHVPSMLAALTFSPGPPGAEIAAWGEAMHRRSSEQQLIGSWPVTDEYLSRLQAVADRQGATLHPVSNGGGRRPLAARHSVPLLLETASDDAVARLRAGAALSAVVLESTRLGLTTSLDDRLYAAARSHTLPLAAAEGLQPQLFLRVG